MNTTTTTSPPAFQAEPETQDLILPSTVVWTPEIDRLASQVAKWIRIDQPGGTVYGAQRNGKSRACSYLAGMLGSVLGYEIAVVHWSIPEQVEAKQTERDFIQEQLLQSKCPRVSSRDLSVLRRRCYTHLVDLARASGSRRIVILIDEAQNLTRMQYGYLIHTFNSLEQLDVYPFFLLVGQPELRNRPDGWAEANGMQVLGRFFAREHLYRGVAQSEIALVLQAFDVPVADETASMFARVFPGAYGAGWSLDKLGTPFEEAIALIMRKHNISKGLRLPMQYLRSTLLGVLHRALDEKKAPEMLGTVDVMHALEASGFLRVLSYYVDSDASGEMAAASEGNRP